MQFDFSLAERLFSFGLELFYALAAGGAAIFGFAFCGSGCGDENCECEDDTLVDYEKLEAKIDELEEKCEAGDVSAQRELADLYLAYAVEKQRDDLLEESVDAYDNAIDLFEELVEKGDDPGLARVLGLAQLSRAVAMTDLGESESAIEGYEAAIETLTPAANSGDGEAKYDIAGIQLNLGTTYHELGEYDTAMKLLDASFLAFRALEKISELDTRFYMGKVSIAQANLARDMQEPIEKVVDLYNRAMRLFVELIDAGDMKHEHDLANALMDKCIARFDAGHGEEVLLDIERAIEILRKVSRDGNSMATIDLFDAMTSQGLVFAKLENNEQALEVFDNILSLFGDFAEMDDIGLLDLYASVYDHRARVLNSLNRPKEAVDAASEAVKIREKFQGEDLEPEAKAFLAASLVDSYCIRIIANKKLGKADLVKADGEKASKLIAPFADELGEDYEEITAQIKEALEG